MSTLKSFIICPNVMILRDNKILLLRRANWAPLWPSNWHCPIGKMEGEESPRDTAIRETYEEVGLRIDPKLGTVIAVTAESFSNRGEVYRDISLFFAATDFEGEPVNMEPRLHDAMDWFEVHNLPEPIIPVVKFGIEQFLKGNFYAEFG